MESQSLMQDHCLTSFVGGQSLAHGGTTLDLIRPGDGSVGAKLFEAGADVVDAAVINAGDGFAVARRSTLHQRSQWLRAMAAAVTDNAEMLAQIVCLDAGKPIRLTRFESKRGAEFLDACASAVLHLAGEMIPVDAAPLGARHMGFTRFVPFGVVGAVTPFNAPINLLVQKVGPAIAAGNAIVVKPAPSGTRVALALARLFVEAGLPKGLFNIVTGDRVTAHALVAHPHVRAVTFTGGTDAGDALIRAAGNKKFLSELGSNAANMVMHDADIDDAAAKIASAAFEASGQQCISAQRILVQDAVAAAFCERFVAAARRLTVGPANDATTDVGPMVHAAAAARVMAMAADAIDRGARVLLMPERRDCIVSPGVFADAPRDCRLWRDEVFGPLAVIELFDTIDEALTLANDSPFGLQGAVFTRDMATAMRFSEDFEVGSLWINEASRFRLDMYPFGGVKSSGTGREGVRYAIEELSQVKFTGLKL